MVPSAEVAIRETIVVLPVDSSAANSEYKPVVPPVQVASSSLTIKKTNRAFALRPPAHYHMMPSSFRCCSFPKQILETLSFGDEDKLGELMRLVCHPNIMFVSEYNGECMFEAGMFALFCLFTNYVQCFIRCCEPTGQWEDQRNERCRDAHWLLLGPHGRGECSLPTGSISLLYLILCVHSLQTW